MDTIKIAGTQTDELAEELSRLAQTRRPAAGDIRLLEDWELAMASGGEYIPTWP